MAKYKLITCCLTLLTLLACDKNNSLLGGKDRHSGRSSDRPQESGEGLPGYQAETMLVSATYYPSAESGPPLSGGIKLRFTTEEANQLDS